MQCNYNHEAHKGHEAEMLSFLSFVIFVFFVVRYSTVQSTGTYQITT
jgi:hypothetical protein